MDTLDDDHSLAVPRKSSLTIAHKDEYKENSQVSVTPAGADNSDSDLEIEPPIGEDDDVDLEYI